MTHSMAIPQDIIYKVIAEVGDDKHLLKQCALVSSSFLMPSRKQLFSKILLRCDRDPYGLYQFLIYNPVIQAFVRHITVTHVSGATTEPLSKNTSLPSILRLPFCCLESFSISSQRLWRSLNWCNLSSELKDALSNIIHSPTLKTLYLKKLVNVPITLFLGIVHLTKLELDSMSPNDFDGVQSSSLVPTASLKGMVSHTVIDQCIWYFWEQLHCPTEPIFLPFMCRLRNFEIRIDPYSANMLDFNIVSFLMRSLRISLTSPATLEYLKFGIWFSANDNHFDHSTFFIDLREADIWRHLDSIITHPAGSRLQRVDITIKYSFRYDDDGDEPDSHEVSDPVMDALPLLREKGILFVKATLGQ